MVSLRGTGQIQLNGALDWPTWNGLEAERRVNLQTRQVFRLH